MTAGVGGGLEVGEGVVVVGGFVGIVVETGDVGAGREPSPTTSVTIHLSRRVPLSF